MNLLAISGSLRAVSSNTTLLKAMRSLAPEEVKITLYEGLDRLPHFNPDLEGAEPTSVLAFRALLQASDGVLISSPEYAHGVPGALKNALDWVVGSGELVEKPVALLNTSPRSAFAQASLTETLTVMTARLIPAASIAVPLAGKNLDEAGILADPQLAPALSAALHRFLQAIAARSGSATPVS